MLGFHLNLYTDLVDFKNIWDKDFGRITKHKNLEMQLMRDGSIFSFEFRLEWSGSHHAGPHLAIGLLFHSFDISIYDHRHWNYDADRWETPEETAEMNQVYEEREKAHAANTS